MVLEKYAATMTDVRKLEAGTYVCKGAILEWVWSHRKHTHISLNDTY